MKARRVATLLFVLGTSPLPSLLHPPRAGAETACEPWAATLVSVQGTVEARRAGQAQWQPARLNDTFCAGDRIQVGDNSRADVALANQPMLRLDQNTTITLGGVKGEHTSLIELVTGAIYFFSHLPRNLEVMTAFVNAGVEGTEGVIRVTADDAVVSIFEGKVLATSPEGSLALTGGHFARFAPGHTAVAEVIVRPRDAVQWALYYPPAIWFRPEDFAAGAGWQGQVRESIDALDKGDLPAAFAAVKGVPDTVGDARFFTYRAALLLTVGRADEAGADLQRARGLAPQSSDALALQSIVAVVHNDKDTALHLARTAVQADATSATALIALSYAQQADFDLEGARASLQRAVVMSPMNALAWARLAEIHLSFAELDAALHAANKAVALDPSLSRTRTVLGFAYLTQVDTHAATAAFETAIAADQSDYLPRLGLGLTKIRQGDLQAGTREIEIATSLDPNSSLVRSYLGKAYFEEKRTQLTDREYAIAKQLDPNDPTPWFYDAIQKQTTNRPVQALQDLQAAIDRNDNRAVYRSRLLLDSDLAARSAALGRIYSDLGFQQLALVEGWKSVNTDPSNFSAHRFLADSYAALPRHEVARVSELLQSQLLQPINITPIQPHLEETNLFLVGAGGPAILSFNEFNPLFTRNGATLQSIGLAGGNNTYAGEGVVAGIYNKASVSAGGSHSQTDGWRSNANQTNDSANAFLQLELSPKTSVQAEYRHGHTDAGDLRLRFAPDDFDPHRRSTETTDSVRVGFRQAFTPQAQLIGNFAYLDGDRNDRFSDSNTTGKDKPFSSELQQLYRRDFISLVAGAGYFYIDSKDHIFPLPPPGVPAPPPMTRDRDTDHANVYLYSYTRLPPHLLVTLGGSGDFYQTDMMGATDQNQFNPKFGVTWNPFDSTTVRGAVFRTLKRTLITNQTLEPTQVAGFNQFFDDLNATQAWSYGAAVDQKISARLFAGTEYTYRDLRVPREGLTERWFDWTENTVRLYLFWTPHDWVALRTGYEWEELSRDPLFADGARLVETNSVPLGLSFFHPSGLSATVNATYINQSGDFQRTNTTAFGWGHDDFWTVDATLNYRLPERYGFLTVGVANLADQAFKHFDTGYGVNTLVPAVVPDRLVYGRVVLALP
jgi:tetratricopeptide (TPR) repeat protein